MTFFKYIRLAMPSALAAALFWSPWNWAQDRDAPELEPPAELDYDTTAAAADGDVRTEPGRILDTITVIGERTEPSYQAGKARSALRSDTPLIETPVSITVITRELIEDQNAALITDLYRNIAGINEFSYSGVSFRVSARKTCAITASSAIRMQASTCRPCGASSRSKHSKARPPCCTARPTPAA